MFKPSREFKANVTAWGFFFLSLAVVIIIIVTVLNSRTSHRASP